MCSAVSPRIKTNGIPTWTLVKKGWFWSRLLCIFPFATLEKSRWSVTIASLHVGRNICINSTTIGKGEPILSLSSLHRVSRSWNIARLVFGYQQFLKWWQVVITFFCTWVSTAHHEVSVFPERETPFFIMFTAGLCTFTALIAFLTHQYPDQMAIVAKTVSTLIYSSMINKLF